MLLSLGFSPCPNDTFIFDALVNKKIDPGPFSWELALEDVQTLNEWAIQGKLDMSKISYGVWPLVQHEYQLLDAGGALGNAVGPLLIAKKSIARKEINMLRIGIPGKNTTAHLLFSLAYPEAENKIFMAFHEIENAVLDGSIDAGVIIHENRFTYAAKGLVKLVDLGEFWEKKLHCPIPLGGIVLRKTMDAALASLLENKIRESIAFAWKNYPQLPPFVLKHSQEMEETVMRQHIELYVNAYSVTLGNPGRKAILQLTETYAKVNGR